MTNTISLATVCLRRLCRRRRLSRLLCRRFCRRRRRLLCRRLSRHLCRRFCRRRRLYWLFFWRRFHRRFCGRQRHSVIFNDISNACCIDAYSALFGILSWLRRDNTELNNEVLPTLFFFFYASNPQINITKVNLQDMCFSSCSFICRGYNTR